MNMNVLDAMWFEKCKVNSNYKIVLSDDSLCVINALGESEHEFTGHFTLMTLLEYLGCEVEFV